MNALSWSLSVWSSGFKLLKVHCVVLGETLIQKRKIFIDFFGINKLNKETLFVFMTAPLDSSFKQWYNIKMLGLNFFSKTTWCPFRIGRIIVICLCILHSLL